ncbi:MAG TPA: ligase-associated DNA damage response endonuclease PdeM [Stellaceae bacterium]|nr:ligase-associated DNA damage response endonuclease PdeM [Stellaceae bacterium]
MSVDQVDPCRLRLNGAELLAEANGVLLWPEHHALVVADLHLEKGSSFATRGIFLPPYDTRATLERLAAIAARHAVRRIICLGDSFHDRDAAERLDDDDAQCLKRLTAATDWIWIAGNHDPLPPAHLGGRAVAGELRLGPLAFRHVASCAANPGEISGHFHPKASLDVRGRRLTGRCFVSDEHRLVMPAFGAYAGGLDVFDPALRVLFPGDFMVHLLARGRIAALPQARLAGAI